MRRNRLRQNVRIVAALLLLVSLANLPARTTIAGPAGPGPARGEQIQKIKPYSRRPSSDALKWADEQLRRMSLEEKIGQLISVGINATFLNQDSDAFKALRHQVEDNHVGGIILFRGPVYESVVLVNRMQQMARYPLLISADLEAGSGMRFDDTVNLPWNMAVGATDDPEYARRQGAVTALQQRPLRFTQQSVGPVQRRPQCLLTRHGCATPPRQQAQMIVETLGDLLHRHRFDPRRR